MTCERHSRVGTGSPCGILAARAFVLPTVFAVLVACGLCASLAPDARAADLVAIRVALHAGFTRIVLESDAPFEYRLPEPASLPETGLPIWIDTTTESRTASIAGDRVPTVRVDPASNGGTDVWIRLDEPVALDTRVLTDPDRLVLDLRPLSATDRSREVVAAEPIEARALQLDRETAAPEIPDKAPRARPSGSVAEVESAELRFAELDSTEAELANSESADVGSTEGELADVDAPIAELSNAELADVASTIADSASADSTDVSSDKAELTGTEEDAPRLASAQQDPEPQKSPSAPASVSAGVPLAADTDTDALPTGTLAIGLVVAAIAILLWLVTVRRAKRAPGRSSRRAVGANTPAVASDPIQVAPAEVADTEAEPLPRAQAAPAEPPPAPSADEVPSADAPEEIGVARDPEWAADLLHMLQRVDERLAALERKLSTLEQQQDNTTSHRDADRQELELHRGALTRLQRRLRDSDRRQSDD